VKDRILILDGLNQTYRANIKFGSKAGDKAAENSVVYIFFRSLRALFEQFSPHQCFFALEGRPQFRYDLFPEYKSNRIIKQGSSRVRDDSFERQKSTILEILQYLPISRVRAAKYEADDAIYTLVNNLRNEDLTIVSSDSDFIQLLQEFHKDKVSLYHPIKKCYLSAPEYSYLVWKSIAGDVSDNIPAIDKKSAIKIASSPSALKEFLSSEENRANFSLNRDLITMRLVPPEELDIMPGALNVPKLKEKFEELQFSSFFKGDYWERFVSTFSHL
jgi:5'-3' exonuclease